VKVRSLLVGTSAMAAASALRIALQITLLPIIGRLLGPVAYGQIALVSPFIFFAILLADSGLGASILRADEVSADLEGSVFWFSMGVSLVIVALFVLLAFPVGRLIDAPNFAPLLLGMAGILFLASLNIVPSALLLRKQRYGWIALNDLIGVLAGTCMVIVGVVLGWGVWSLVAQQVGLWLGKLAVVMIGARWRPRFKFQWKVVRDLLPFGSRLTGATIIQFIDRNIDNVLIGTFMGAETLGFYALAWQIVTMPSSVLSGSIYFTIFSSTSQMHRDSAFTPALFLRALKAAIFISAPILIGLAATAPLAITLIVGERWIPAVAVVQLLTPLGLCQTIVIATMGLMNGFGRSDISLRFSIFNSALTIAGIAIGVCFSSAAVAGGVSVAALLGLVVLLREAIKLGGFTIRDFWNAIFAPLTAALVMGAVVITTQESVLTHASVALRLAINILVGVVTYVTVLFGLFRSEFIDEIEQFRTLIHRTRVTAKGSHENLDDHLHLQ
jgi:O-antigen/teichoic acid export membrane protein